MTRLLAYLPRGNTLDDKVWHKRHVFLQAVLLLHLPCLFVFGVAMGRSVQETLVVLSIPAACLVLGRLIPHRRTASVLITAGLTYCSAALVSFSNGSIEAHFHFFVMIGFIALYQDWVPFLWNVVFTVLSHGIGSAWRTNLIFNHPAGQTSPWVWSAIHGAAVLAACVGVVIFWETTEREQRKTLDLSQRLADAEIARRRFTSDLLVNLARRNQSLLYRQLGLINQLEDQEQDADALADLFRLDHLATRIRRNAESLLVLSGEEPPRTWGRPVALVDVVRAAIAETEDLDRVVFAVDERLAVLGNAVADLTHLMAELVENAVHFSPPEASVILRTRPYLQTPGAHVLTVEDWGVGMRADDLADANELLATPHDVDLSVSRRLGLHVVARLAQRHSIAVSLTPTPGCGVTAAVVLPPSLFSNPDAEPDEPFAAGAEVRAEAVPAALAAATVASADPSPVLPRWAPSEQPIDLIDAPPAGGNGHGPDAPPADDGDWSGWWEPPVGDRAHGEPVSPIAARPPLSQRVQATPSQVAPAPPLDAPTRSMPDRGAPDRSLPAQGLPAQGMPDRDAPARSAPAQGTPDPHPPGVGAPEREGSRAGSGGRETAHSPQTYGAATYGAQPHGPQTYGAQTYGAQTSGAQVHGPQSHGSQPYGAQPYGPLGPAPVGSDGGEELLLARRVPQAHLAPELRRIGQGAAAARADGPLPDAAEARAALSRYQASRQAAKALVDEGGDAGGQPGSERPPSAGGWS